MKQLQDSKLGLELWERSEHGVLLFLGRIFPQRAALLLNLEGLRKWCVLIAG